MKNQFHISRPMVASLTAIALMAAAAAPPAYARPGDVELVNVVPGGFADNTSAEASISGNGDFVAFSSYADNLDDEDGPFVLDVFLRGMAVDQTLFLSRADGPDGIAGGAASSDPSVSANGVFVAFTSAYNGFSDADGPGLDVFVRDVFGHTTFVSRASGENGDGGDANSYGASISADGRYVAFESNADNLDAASNDVGNVFVRDLVRNKTILVSRRSGKNGKGADSSSTAPSISANGKRVVFHSGADNLSSADNDGYTDVYLRDLASAKTTLVSRKSGAGAGGNNDSVNPAISANGRHVAFESRASNFASDFPGNNYGVFVRNMRTERTVLASRSNSGREALDNSLKPSISGNGRYVAFVSKALNLSNVDNDVYQDIFVRDLETERTSLVSRGPGTAGQAAAGDSFAPAISANGRHVAFTSNAGNLSDADADGLTDIFRRDIRDGKTIR